ncbi:MAG: hypothetical protein JXR03_18275 [Cyclobacteriaceae bacterium]
MLGVTLFLTTLTVYSQEPQGGSSEKLNETNSEDSVRTPFRKDRRLTGLSGSISSGTNEINNQKTFSNRYSLNFVNGQFSNNGWLFGARINATRENSEGFSTQESESLFAGPMVAYYFAKNSSQGSLFLQVSPGYVRFRSETIAGQGAMASRDVLKGQGVGGIIKLGYSYVIHDRVVFDLGVDVSDYGIWAERKQEPSANISKERISVSDISFSFGFNILLEDYFF